MPSSFDHRTQISSSAVGSFVNFQLKVKLFSLSEIFIPVQIILCDNFVGFIHHTAITKILLDILLSSS